MSQHAFSARFWAFVLPATILFRPEAIAQFLELASIGCHAILELLGGASPTIGLLLARIVLMQAARSNSNAWLQVCRMSAHVAKTSPEAVATTAPTMTLRLNIHSRPCKFHLRPRSAGLRGDVLRGNGDGEAHGVDVAEVLNEHQRLARKRVSACPIGYRWGDGGSGSRWATRWA